jgi:hypothetical protein
MHIKEKALLKFLRMVNNNLIIAIPAAMAVGFLFGLNLSAAPLKNLIPGSPSSWSSP